MEYNSLSELYRALLPVFNVKKRLLSITLYKDLNNEESINKWKNSHNLTIADIVNDIIMIDAKDIINKRGELQ